MIKGLEIPIHKYTYICDLCDILKMIFEIIENTIYSIFQYSITYLAFS